MRKHLLTAVFCLLAGTLGAQQKLTIVDQDYEQAKRTAAAQHKLLLIDFYTTWCVPCKELDRMIFQNDSIAGDIGKNFVVLKYDAERDAAHNLSLKHHIASYPTTLALAADGRVIGKMYGTGGEGSLETNYRRFTEEMVSLNRNADFLTGVAAAIDTAIYPAFYKRYVRRLADIGPNDLTNFWKGAADLKAELSFDILAYFGRAPRHVVDYFLLNKAAYEMLYGKADVKFVVNNIVGDRFRAAVNAKSDAAYAGAKQFAAQQLPVDEAAKYAKAYELEMRIATGKWQQAADLIRKEMDQKSLNENAVNAFCWTVYEQCPDNKVITRAIGFMKELTDRNPQFATLDTYARLLAKAGRKDAAVVAMNQAIGLGKAAGEDTQESEAAMRKF